MTNYSKTKRKRKPLRQFHANSHTSDPWSEKAKVLTENVCKQQKEVLFGSYYLKSHSLEFHAQTQKEEAFGRAHWREMLNLTGSINLPGFGLTNAINDDANGFIFIDVSGKILILGKYCSASFIWIASTEFTLHLFFMIEGVSPRSPLFKGIDLSLNHTSPPGLLAMLA